MGGWRMPKIAYITKPGPKPLSKEQFIDRFWQRVNQSDGPESCWTWQGYRTAFGYGLLQARRIDPQPMLAHRVAWELTNGPIYQGGHVLHYCDNPPCCNPTHLFLGDQRANNADMIAKGRLKIGGRTRMTWTKGQSFSHHV